MPNAGFLEDVVFEDPSLSTTSQQSDADPTSDHENGDNRELEVSVDDSNDDQQITTDFGDLKVAENDQSDKGTNEDQNTLLIEDVDALLDKCLLQAFYTTLKDKDLPIAGSTLW